MTADPRSPQIVASHLTEWEAAALIDYLVEQGIEAHAWGANTAALHGEVGPRESVKVVVKQCDVERATSAIEEFRRR